MPGPALAMLRLTSTTLLRSQRLTSPLRLEPSLVPRLSASVTTTKVNQTDSWVVVRSATIGSSPLFGSEGLRPTFRALSKETTLHGQTTSVGPSRVALFLR